ncbi:MAG: M28 family peptidase [Planctomycetota bacterium]
MPFHGLRPAVWVSCLAPCLTAPPVCAEEAASVEARLGRTIRFLASDELGGRGLGTPGIDRAAEYLHREFEARGLQTNTIDGGPFQRFEVTLKSELADGATAALVDADGRQRPLRLGREFNPLAVGGGGDFDLPMAFVGYGITAPEAGYDDYAGIDVTGKAVVILRHEPQQANPHSPFNGADNSEHAPFSKKLSNAVQHGAAAVMFVTDRYEIEKRLAQLRKRLDAAEGELAKLSAESPTAAEPGDGESNGDATSGGSQPAKSDVKPAADRPRGNAARRANTLRAIVSVFRKRIDRSSDPLLGFTRAGDGSGRDLPVLALTRAPLDEVLESLGKPSLDTLEAEIDDGPSPQSFDLPGVRLVGSVEIDRQAAPAANVVGVLPGEGPLADEAIVIGAHYDHLGRGGLGSTKPGSREVHNGADDNASGVAALLETVRVLSTRQEPLPRTVVFVAFTGEERGLLGSAEYVRNPVVPLEKTVAMLNFDMVGRLAENKLIVNGTGTAEEFDAWIDELNEKHAFSLTKSPEGFGPSDHSSFYARQLPVLHFFTGLHPEYHKPEDDFGLLNVPGIRRVTAMVGEMAVKIAEAPARVAYVAVEQPRIAMGPGDPRPYFGSIPDLSGGTGAAGGYAISGVAPRSPAAEAGLKGGDKITRLGEYTIGNLDDFDGALRKFSAGDKVKVVVRRGGQAVEIEVILDPPR